MTKNLILSGKPGVGKTTLIKEATLPFRDRLGGFYTEQILDRGQRIGFMIVTFDQKEAVLASKEMSSQTRINKYGVDLNALESVGVRAVAEARERKSVVVIDEIGSMEILSDKFREEASACLNGPKAVLAAVRQGAHAFTDSVKKMDQTRVIELTRADYDGVKQEVREWLEAQAR